MLALRIIMPSEGDMVLLAQAGGVIDLQPVFYGNDGLGPVIQVVEGNMVKNPDLKKSGTFEVTKVAGHYRLKIRTNGKIELKPRSFIEQAEETEAE